jgi:hypothetical protein
MFCTGAAPPCRESGPGSRCPTGRARRPREPRPRVPPQPPPARRSPASGEMTDAAQVRLDRRHRRSSAISRLLPPPSTSGHLSRSRGSRPQQPWHGHRGGAAEALRLAVMPKVFSARSSTSGMPVAARASSGQAAHRLLAPAADGLHALADQDRAAVDQAGVDCTSVRAGGDLADRIGAVRMPPTPISGIEAAGASAAGAAPRWSGRTAARRTARRLPWAWR